MENEYHQRIIRYYKETENAYKDSWDLDKSLSIHYGYWDKQVRNFPDSLKRMNEIMMITGNVKAGDRVLDAGCGVGGSSIFLASMLGCRVTGISLSERQVIKAREYAMRTQLDDLADFEIMDYSNTRFPDATFDVVWGCESICYADNKESFIKEAFRILKPGGRLVIADGFVTTYDNNQHPVIRRWLDGWQVNYLETPGRMNEFMEKTGFKNISYKDISRETFHSVKRLYRYYWLASLYLLWKKMSFSKPATTMQKMNIAACKYQYLGRKKGLWVYGCIVASKPG